MAAFSGKVKWFDAARGFGFLQSDDGADVFVHYRAIQTRGYKSLKEGDRVSFDIIEGARGPKADRVTGVPLSSFTVRVLTHPH